MGDADSLWRQQLNAVQATHDVAPLPAYATEDDSSPIDPRLYEEKLAGAIVLATISLRNHKFKYKSNLAAHVEEMHVLASPVQLPKAPQKRKFMGHVIDKNASKKKKFD